MLRKFLYLACSAGVLASISLAQELRVDINHHGRPVSEGLAAGYVPWSDNPAWFSGGDQSTQSLSGLQIQFRRVGDRGSPLRPGYWKAGVQNNEIDAKLIGDGVKVEGGDTGARIEMRIQGMATGSHTLLVYHNAWDNVVASDLAPLEVLCNGELKLTGIRTSARATERVNSGASYFAFEVTNDEELVFLFAADQTSSARNKNVYINGFEIDTSNPKLKATQPFPRNGDYHVDVEDEALALRWKGAPPAVSHQVYFGESESAVASATMDSEEYLGMFDAPSVQVEHLNTKITYFWRVDERDAQGVVTRGDIWSFRPRHLAFPGAEGYGRFAHGGRGGSVVHVTNLNDSGPGSLREAVTGAFGPRTVVFGVGGMITLNSRLTISDSFITIAGQTAPGKGVCVRGWPVGLSGAKDVIVRNLRVRPGDIAGATIDGMGMQGSDHCMMDRCSISWTIDEAFSSRAARNITLQRTLISEALNIAGHDNYSAGAKHGFAASIGGDVGSFHHNLLAHCQGRNWSLAGGLDGAGFFAGRLDIFNNVVYNWGHRTTDGGAHEVNFVNNFYKPGPATTYFRAIRAQYGAFPGTQQYFVSGNVMPGYFGPSDQEKSRARSTENGGTLPTAYETWVDEPFFESHASIQSAALAYRVTLSDVGANQPTLDDQDLRVIRETLEGSHTFTGRGPYGGSPGLPNSQVDVGGWEEYPFARRPVDFDIDGDGLPNWWEAIHGTNINSPAKDFRDSNWDRFGDGYTELERYLNWLAEPHVDALVGEFVDVDLSELSRGFGADRVHYSVGRSSNGKVELVKETIARFTPTTSRPGLGSFQFSVSVGPELFWSREIGVRIRKAR